MFCVADINATNSIGESAVFVAAACDNPETIATAAKLGANLTLRSELDEAPMDVSMLCVRMMVMQSRMYPCTCTDSS